MSIRILLLLLTFCIAGCERSNDESVVEAPTSTKLEADLRLVVIETCLNRYYSEPGSTILVRTPASTHGFLDFEDDKEKEDFIAQVCQPDLGIGQLERATVVDFIKENQDPAKLALHDIGGADWVEVITEEEFKGYWSDDVSTKEGWAALMQKYPKAIGVVEVSSFGWNPEMSEGLLYVGKLTNPGIGGGAFYALRRHGSQYSCHELIGAPSWITKANKTRLDNPIPDPSRSNLMITTINLVAARRSQ
jgi:hypothetical protein